MLQIILIITGSIAANKGIKLFYDLKKKYNVKLIITEGAKKFIETIPPENINDKNNLNSLHVDINKKNDLLVVYPASQNFIAKIANGFSDNLSSLIWSANNSYKIVFPAMNSNMYKNKATINNINKLREYGVEVLKPKIGLLACKTIGEGRAWEWQDVSKHIDNYFKFKNKLSNTNILLSYGKTRTYIDPIRYITNNASGKMGQALYESLKLTSANVTLISGDVEEKIYSTIKVKSNQEMMQMMKERFNKQDIVINLAALNDFKVVNKSSQKISKRKHNIYNLKLTKNIDVLEELGKIKNHQILIGFSAQEKLNDKQTALEKIKLKNLDAIIVNQIDVMGKNDTTVKFITKNNEQYFSGTKKNVAQKIVEQIILLKELKRV